MTTRLDFQGGPIESVKLGLIYAVAESMLLCFTLNLFKVEFKAWHAATAALAAGLCAAAMPSAVAGIISLVVLFAVLYFTTGQKLEELMYPIFVARLALVPVLLLVGKW